MSEPSKNTIALAALLLGKEWMAADEIAHAVAKLGFEMPSSQRMGGLLTAMCKESCPRFERRKELGGYHSYRVTGWAMTGLSNTWDRFAAWRPDSVRLPDLPAPQPEHLRATQEGSEQ